MDSSRYVQAVQSACGELADKFDALAMYQGEKAMFTSPNWKGTPSDVKSYVDAWKDSSIESITYKGDTYRLHPRSYDNVLTSINDDKGHVMIRFEGQKMMVAHTTNFLSVNEFWLEPNNFSAAFKAADAFSGFCQVSGAIANKKKNSLSFITLINMSVSVFFDLSDNTIINNDNEDIITFKSTLCIEHQRQCEFLCFDCTVLLCSKCIITKHKSHQIDDADTISQSIITHYNDNDIDNIIFRRMQSILNNLNQYNNQLNQYKEKEDVISKYYRDLHDHLMIEEYKLKKPFIDERERIKSIISNLSSQLHSLSLTIRDIIDSNNNNNNNSNSSGYISSENINGSNELKFSNNSNDIDIADNLCSFNCIISYLNSLNNNNSYYNNNNNSNSNNNNNEELLYKIKYYLYQLSCNNNCKLIDYKSINVELEDIEIVKQSLSSIYDIDINSIDDSSKRSVIISSSIGGGLYTLDAAPATSGRHSIDYRWNKIFNDDFIENQCLLNRTLFVDGRYLYCFGGSNLISKKLEFSRLCLDNLNTHTLLASDLPLKWEVVESQKSCPPIGALGSSICYDESSHSVYVIGGLTPQIVAKSTYQSKIYQFNLQSRQLSVFGENPNPTVCSSCFVSERVIYIIGGLNTDFKENRSLVSIDIDTDNHQRIQKILNLNHDYSMVAKKNHIYLMGGADFGNHKYSIKRNHWVTIKDNDIMHRNGCASFTFELQLQQQQIQNNINIKN
ncbi:hypothetical protein PPL_00409 [Heterostelium album PN500]|uniref:B box-type domain-containing protein n=1 Tax=Heterostelium pallidum (strain ATCC 26659 / Pp 5 / PN500) TaxID=670386 RepID=D3AWD5_HETP5|nr:hypothetical protein PPL_00409 [Heterostelium album PN500]EFA86608.1 hypothetical protein PPL_00409 [Heterostelium album PN500]|eukprot:XP_020438713.1 hypothetical protein PPL_00409 [Heterostelium album PN500]